MEKYEIGIVILNYNTPSDTLLAIESIVKYTHIKYKICIVDNSDKIEGRVKKDYISYRAVDVLFLNENKGYASGNNQGLIYLTEKYNPDYLLVMNPDVILLKDRTIDNLVNKLDQLKPLNICGIQPLVWTPRFGINPNNQINIRKVYDYFDCCVSSFHPLAWIFRKRSKRITYRQEMPFLHDVFFEVPSGCFFIMESQIFKAVNFFDPNTFLFNEELILGYKVAERGKRFCLDIDNIVQHEQGSSTGAKVNKISQFLKKQQKCSLNIYMREYLKVSRLSILFVDILIELNYIGRLIKYNCLKLT